MTTRQDFSIQIIQALAGQVGYHCSNPDCRRPTIGPNNNPLKATLIGEAAHIVAATIKGPRGDSLLPLAERGKIDNAVWLCANCHTLIDKDPDLYPVGLLINWKQTATERARLDLELSQSIKTQHIIEGDISSFNPSQQDSVKRVLSAYIDALLRHSQSFTYLTINSLAEKDRLINLPYVPIRLKRGQVDQKQEVKLKGLFTQPPTLDSGGADSPHQPLPRHRLILGDPGIGKSTLLRQIARFAWEDPAHIGLETRHIPLLVRLHSLASVEGSPESRLVDALYHSGELVTIGLDFPSHFIKEWSKIANAPWLFLFDGLDEVPDEKRLRLIQWLNGFVDSLKDGNHRVIITSRPVGNPFGELGSSFEHFDLLPFSNSQVLDLIHELLGEDQTRFLAELNRIQAGNLLGTPLLITVAALVYRRDGTLPSKLTDLYYYFIHDIFLSEPGNWPSGIGLSDGFQVLPELQVKRLAFIAYRVTEFAGMSNLHVLAGDMAKYFLENEPGIVSNLSAQPLSEKYLKVMGKRSGVLLADKENFYFLHATFREYLAALFLAQKYEKNPDRLLATVRPKLLSDDWSNILTFILSLLEDADPLILLLLNADRKDKKFHRPLFIITNAMARGLIISERLRKKVIDNLIKLAETSRRPTLLFHEEDNEVLASEVMRVISQLDLDQYLVRKLNTIINNVKTDIHTRIHAAALLNDRAALLGFARQGKELAVSYLMMYQMRSELRSIVTDPGLSPRIRINAAISLGRLGQNEFSTSYIFQIIQNNPYQVRITDIIRFFEETANAQALLRLFRIQFKRQEIYSTTQTVNALIAIGAHKESALACFELCNSNFFRFHSEKYLKMLGELDEYEYLRQLAVKAEAQIVPAQEPQKSNADLFSFSHFTDLFADNGSSILDLLNTDLEIALKAVDELNNHGQAALLSQIAKDHGIHPKVRSHATRYYAQLGQADEAAEIWLCLAQNSQVRGREHIEQSINALEELKRTDLLTNIITDPNAKTLARSLAWESLGRIGGPEILTDLINIRNQEPDTRLWPTIHTAISAIQQRVGEQL